MAYYQRKQQNFLRNQVPRSVIVSRPPRSLANATVPVPGYASSNNLTITATRNRLSLRDLAEFRPLFYVAGNGDNIRTAAKIYAKHGRSAQGSFGLSFLSAFSELCWPWPTPRPSVQDIHDALCFVLWQNEKLCEDFLTEARKDCLISTPQNSNLSSIPSVNTGQQAQKYVSKCIEAYCVDQSSVPGSDFIPYLMSTIFGVSFPLIRIRADNTCEFTIVQPHPKRNDAQVFGCFQNPLQGKFPLKKVPHMKLVQDNGRYSVFKPIWPSDIKSVPEESLEATSSTKPPCLDFDVKDEFNAIIKRVKTEMSSNSSTNLPLSAAEPTTNTNISLFVPSSIPVVQAASSRIRHWSIESPPSDEVDVPAAATIRKTKRNRRKQHRGMGSARLYKLCVKYNVLPST